MSFKHHMQGYQDPRTLYQVDALYALKHGKYAPPVLVEVDPISGCNQNCIYCYANRRTQRGSKLRKDVLVRIFGQLAEAGVKAVLFQGTGEPLLHPEVAPSMEEAARHGLTIGLNTNGVLLNKSLQERILQHLFYIKFSVIDSDPKRYAYLHGCSEKQWAILQNNMEYAVQVREKRNLKVSLWATQYLDENNFHDAYRIARFYKEKGLDYIVIQEATYSEYSPAGERGYASRCFTEGEIREMKEKVLSLKDDHFNVKVVFPLINDSMNYAGQTKENFVAHFCQGPKLYSTICSDGEIYPCWRMWGRGKEFSYGSLYENTFEEIWKGEKRKRIEEYINTTPPGGAECMVCNHARLNEILYKFLNADSKWMDFII
jgi:radical SAM protein with 4Fe4S-binding SPASM domain